MLSSIKRVCRAALFLPPALLAVGCHGKNENAPHDNPRLTPKVVLRDITFHSVALNRTMSYRVILPAATSSSQRLPVVYLLHGGGGSFRDWSNDSDVVHFAETGLILVMAEGDSSYYMNSAERSQDRYEDYIVNDLISDVQSKLPVAADRANRAIVGVSMGGFGAVKLGLSHPELFVFTGGISPALDVPSRPFSIKRVQQWRYHSSIFGPWGSQTRHDDDPFILARSTDPAKAPYFFLSCGEQEGLLAANRRFAALLAQRHFRYEFHSVPGGHDWSQWNAQLPSLYQSLREHGIPAS